MKKELSLVERLIKFMRSNPDTWVPGGELERLALSVGYKASNISRRARELVEDGTLERRENSKGHVEYKWRKSERVISKYVEVNGVMKLVQEKVFI